MSNAPWLDWASTKLHIKEAPRDANNPVIVQWGKDAGIDWYRKDSDAWCAVFVNAALVHAGYPSTKSALARSFTSYGSRLAKPVPGAIVVFPRGSNPMYGHVGIVKTVNSNGTITVVNGNVGDEVRESIFRIAAILPDGIRWPPGAPMPGQDGSQPHDQTAGPRTLREGMRGEDVEALQRDLNTLNYKLAVDGIYGGATKNAVIAFQARRDMVADGIVGQATLSALEAAVAARVKTLAAKETAEETASDTTKLTIGGGLGLAGSATVAAQVADSFRGWAPTAIAIVVVAALVVGGAWYAHRILVKRATERARDRDEEPEAVG